MPANFVNNDWTSLGAQYTGPIKCLSSPELSCLERLMGREPHAVVIEAFPQVLNRWAGIDPSNTWKTAGLDLTFVGYATKRSIWR